MATTVKAPAVPRPVLETEDDDAPRPNGHRWHTQLVEFPDLAPQGARLINGVWYALHPRAPHLWRKLSPVPGMPGEWRGSWQTGDPVELFHRQFEHRLDGKVRECWRFISPEHDERDTLLAQFPHLAPKLVDDLGPKPDKKPGDVFGVGERILVHATVLEKCSSNWPGWLDRHARADFGDHGTLCEPGDVCRWLVHAASVAEANSLAIERGSGLVTSRYRQEDKWGCEICTLLFPGRPAERTSTTSRHLGSYTSHLWYPRVGSLA